MRIKLYFTLRLLILSLPYNKYISYYYITRASLYYILEILNNIIKGKLKGPISVKKNYIFIYNI